MPHEPGKAFDTAVMCQWLLYVVLRDPIGEQCAALFALMPPPCPVTADSFSHVDDPKINRRTYLPNISLLGRSRSAVKGEAKATGQALQI